MAGPIVADYGEGATVLFKGSGADIALLDLGSSVCALGSGMPASTADRLAPPGAHWPRSAASERRRPKPPGAPVDPGEDVLGQALNRQNLGGPAAGGFAAERAGLLAGRSALAGKVLTG